MTIKKTLSLAVYLLIVLVTVAAPPKGGKKDKKKKGLTTFGETITKSNAISVTELENFVANNDNSTVKITGKINEVCKVKGCWMTADLGKGKTMRITFKDYGFFVPKDAGGKTFWAEGDVVVKTTSVEMLRHYAEDAGKSKEEIEAIKEPKQELTFVAKGVIVE